MKKRILSTLLALCMVLTLLPGSALAVDSDVEYTDVSDWLLSDACYDEAKQSFVLTEDYTRWEKGSIWYNHPCYSDFTLEMDYYTGSTNRALSGADGIAVAFYANYEYTMAGGEQLGFNGSKGYGIELDTFRNSGRGDPNYNHIALIKESVGNHLVTERLPESEDEQWHHLKIVVEGGICSAYVDSTLKLSHEVESTGYGWIGITAATGDGENLHAVKNIIITDDGNHTVDNYVDIRISNTLISDSDGQYKYKITADVENSGGATAENVTVTLDLADQLQIADSMPLSYELGDIDYEESKQVTWTVCTDWPETSTTANYGVTANINNAVSLRQEDYIYLKSKNENSNAFVFGMDQWSFSNSGEYFTDGKAVYDSNGNFVHYVETYFLNDTDYKALTAGLSNLEKDIIYKKRLDNWGGSCYGMSSVSILSKMGIVEPSSIQGGKNNLHSITMANNDSVESFINFYFLQQYLLPSINDRTYFELKNTSTQLREIEEKAESVSTGGTPVLLCFSGDEGAHAVVAYGVEHGEFTLKDGFLGTTLFGTKYDTRILIYDCNYPEGSNYSYLWYNTGTDEWCIPNYPWADKLIMACNDIDILDCINHDIAVSNYTAWLDFKGDAAGYFFEQAGLLKFIDSSTDMREEGLVTYYAPNITAEGVVGSNTMTLTLPSLTDSYSVIPLEGEDSDFTIYYENSALSVVTEEAEQINFSPKGKVEATGVSGQYSMSLVFNEGYYSLPWYKTSINGADSASVSMEQVENGVIIAGSNLKGVVVTVESDAETRSLKFTTDKESVLLTSETTDDVAKPVIMLDSDDDGIYDEVYGIYTITVNANPSKGGTVSGGGDYNAGTSVTVEATPASGYRFVRWTESDTEVSTSATYEFTAEENRILTAVFEQKSNGGGGVSTPSTPSYQIIIPTAPNGIVTATPTSAQSGTTVTITTTPDDGYTTDSVAVTDSRGKNISITDNGDGTHTFTMPASQVTVGVTFAWINPFTDVAETDWFCDEVAYVAQNGLMTGTSDTTFAPNATTTRAMIVTILYRLEKSPAAGSISFDDVEAETWYTEAVAWAAANGIIDGYGNGKFGSNDPITREQMAAILYRYADYKGYKVSGLADLANYTDAEAISDWALTAMRWANEEGLITGRTTTTLVPNGTATRAEVAAILMRFCQNVTGLE